MLIASLIIALGTAAYGVAVSKLSILAIYGLQIPFYFLPRALRRALPSWHGPDGEARVRTLERCLLAVVTFNALGTLGLHSRPLQYDRWLHFSAAFASVIALFTVLRPPAKTPIRRPARMFIILLLAGIIGSVMVEVTQYSLDRAFGTKTFFDVAQPIERDVAEDLTFDLLGIAAAMVVAKRAIDRARPSSTPK